jgi:hypothetical protein
MLVLCACMPISKPMVLVFDTTRVWKTAELYGSVDIAVSSIAQLQSRQIMPLLSARHILLPLVQFILPCTVPGIVFAQLLI